MHLLSFIITQLSSLVPYLCLCVWRVRGELNLEFFLSISCKVDLLPTHFLSFYLPGSLYYFYQEMPVFFLNWISLLYDKLFFLTAFKTFWFWISIFFCSIYEYTYLAYIILDIVIFWLYRLIENFHQVQKVFRN